MTADVEKRMPAWLQIALIALLFAGPLILAAWLYFDGVLQPAGRTNHGEILEPVVNLNESLPNSSAPELSEGRWLLVYSNGFECGEACREALYTLRQARLMLGNDMQRLLRVFLHGPAVPDKALMEQQHPGLRLIEDQDLSELLEARRPQGSRPGGLFLVDPLGNLVMYFPPDIDPVDMVEDIQHLLDLSRIG